MPLKKYLLYLLLLTGSIFPRLANGQEFSYVYIQGDKKTPFYVKFEGEMLPRYGKNYYIISELAPGPINVEILFQQNAFPAQKFVIQVPEKGFRGFLLTQKGDYFSLYDLHQQFYLPAGNKAEDDRPPVYEPTVVSNDTVVSTPTTSNTKISNKVKVKKDKPAKPVVVKAVNKPTVDPPPVEDGPQFINSIELGNKAPDQGTVATGRVIKNKVAIVNSDCPKAMDNSAFQALFKKVSNKSGTDRLKLLLEKMNDCFTTNQVRTMAKMLTDDAAKFTYFKKVYPHVTDQSAFANLDKLLTTDEWKGYFKELVKQ
jgi:hypothetical protein